MLFIVIAIFAICWLPFQAYNILQEIYPSINDYKYINLIWFSCHLFAMSNSCYNPFIYAIYGEKFNQEFRKRFYCCCFWASRVSGGPATPTTLLRSVDHMTSQVTHLNDAVTPRHKGGSYPLHILNPAGRKRNSKRSGHASPAFIPASPDCNALLSENISLKNNPCVSIGSPASANGDRHQKHIICRKSSKKTSIKTNGNQVQYDDSRNPAPDEEGGHPLQSPVVSEKEMISLSSSGDKKSICLEPLIADDNDDGKVSYV